jgi:hypothetical protein
MKHLISEQFIKEKINWKRYKTKEEKLRKFFRVGVGGLTVERGSNK